MPVNGTPQGLDPLYYRGFEVVQRHSDEKPIYIATFAEYITKYDVSSILDIGAGDGEVALPISAMVDDYTAIEQNVVYAARLRAAGKKVIEGTFPEDIDDSYDLVLMSHVISHTAGNHTALVPPAWKLVRPEGHLLVVTHKGTEPDDWSQLLDSVGFGYSERFTSNIHSLIKKLEGRGKTEIQKVTSTLKTDSLSQMLEAMAFFASNGEADRYQRFMSSADEVSRVLDEQYSSGDGFSFPFLHLFVSTQKTNY